MENISDRIERLRIEKERLRERLELIDRVLSAYELLVKEQVLVSDNINIEVVMKNKSCTKENGGIVDRNAKVRLALEQLGKPRFTVPDISRLTGLNKRRTKRAVDAMVEKGQIQIIEKGFKRRPTKYEVIQMK